MTAILKNVTFLGSCRNNIPYLSNSLSLLNFPYCTKEIIQMIRFFRGELPVFDPVDKVIFHQYFTKGGGPIDYSPNMKIDFDASCIYVVEISSRKKYIYDGKYYVHQLTVDSRYSRAYEKTPIGVKEKCVLEIQSDKEIKRDILEIQSMLKPKPVLVITHYYPKSLNSPAEDALKKSLEKRKELADLVVRICKMYQIPVLNPAEEMSGWDEREMVMPDWGHYTHKGQAVWYPHLTSKIESIVAQSTK